MLECHEFLMRNLSQEIIIYPFIRTPMNLSLFVSAQNRLRSIIDRSPFSLFFFAIALLFAVIALAHFSRQPIKEEKTNEKESKSVESFVIGTNTVYAEASALVKKDTIQPIVALIPGTIQEISVHPGSRVSVSTPLLRISGDYGTNRAGLETSLAEKNQKFSESMRKLDRQIIDLEKKKVRHDDTLDSTSEDLELKRLKRERSSLDESLSNGSLSIDISRAGESVFNPKSFAPATVEHIAVHVGDFVTPGTVLAIVRTDQGSVTLETSIDASLARSFDATLPSKIHLENGESIDITPSYFSSNETPDGFFIVRYLLSKEISGRVIGGTRVSVSLPLRAPDQKVFVPLDALFTHTDHASLFVEQDGKAEEKTVAVQTVFGSNALLSEALPIGTAVLLNRTLISGESVSPR